MEGVVSPETSFVDVLSYGLQWSVMKVIGGLHMSVVEL
jgi:hypothetical protein